jgi:phosphonoacetate hydrolase
MIELNARSYRIPRRKTAVFCIDGCAPEYLDCALADGLMPRLSAVLDAGAFYTRGLGQMPSFTNPNNLSIVTGVPPSEHGISGNTCLDRATGHEVPMTDPRMLRATTIFERLEQHGVRTLVVTAKDKLRALLGATREGGPAPLALSAERAHEARLDGVPVVDLVGRKNPGIYEWDISHYAMEMALAIHDRIGAKVVYVSLTDYVQHKEPPRGPMSDRFHARFDELLGDFLDRGFVCGITADHGMNDKTAPDGSPNVRYLDDLLRAAGLRDFHVVLPITDPYVVHHGALGSFATVYLAAETREAARRALASVPGIELVLDREEAAARFALPADRLGDLVVLGDRGTVLGKSASVHDLSAVARGLRSHGGLAEQPVPILVTRPLTRQLRRSPTRPLTNADIFDLALNEAS